MAFLTETEPARGIAQDILPGIRRITARNGSVMTYHGTNTYLIDDASGLTVLDPGPDDARHVQDILAAAGRDITRIVVTHAHNDHFGAAAALAAASGAPVVSHGGGLADDFKVDMRLADGDVIGGLTAVFTPGHAIDHLCFEYTVPGTGKILFSGDHVMSWSSSIVSPPDGNMLDYYRSLELLLRRDEVLYLPGHGPLLPDPRALTAQLLAHRQKREASIMARLQRGPAEVAVIAEDLYHKTHLWLKMAARFNVLAHLLKLQAENIVVELPPGTFQEEALGEIDPATRGMMEGEGALAAKAKMTTLSLRRFALAPAL